MRALTRFLVVVEAIICFGPLLVLLGIGILFVPFWLMGLALEPQPSAEPVPFWDFLYPVLLVLFGTLGTLTMIAVVLEIACGKQWFGTRLRRWLFAPGLLGVLMFNWPWVPTVLAREMTLDAIWPLSIYFVLPVASSIHLLWLASTVAHRRQVARDVTSA